MKQEGFIGISNDLSSKEYTKINSILKEYSIEPVKIEKIRSVYKVTTEGRIYCLKRMKHGGEEKVQKGMLLGQYLISKGFYHVVKYIKTNDNKICIKRSHYIYYVTYWMKGRESNFDNFEELKKCAAFLADFHIKSKGFTIESSKIINNYKKWPTIFKQERNDLNIIREVIISKKVKTSFDINYLNAIDDYIDVIDMTIKLLDDSHYIDISNNSSVQKTVCHDSFYYQNILLKRNDRMYLIDLDSSLYDIHVYDLAKFIRRILYQSNYAWDFNVAKDLIETYRAVNPISKDEYEILLAFILFPHKFWKLGKKRYVKNKNWNETKYLRKIDKLIKYEELEQKFLNDYLEYVNHLF